MQFLKYSALSKAGRNNKKQVKTNQDSYCMIKGFCGPQTNWYFGVFDGHGMYGHLASDFAAKNLNSKILQIVKDKSLKISVGQALHGLKQPVDENTQIDFNNLDEQFMKETLQQAYEWTGDAMGKSGIETTFSGTTAVTLIVTKDYFITSNVGDSRCILIKKDNDVQQLSRDHKPNLSGESERILAANGRIESYKDF